MARRARRSEALSFNGSKALQIAGTVIGSTAAGIGALYVAAAAIVARAVVTPPRKRVEDIRVEQFWTTRNGSFLKLSGTKDARTSGNPGLFSFWFDDDRGHAVLGPIIDRSWDTVTRRVLRVDSGDLTVATRGRINGWVWTEPHELGLPWSEVTLEGPNGTIPAWEFPAAKPSDVWAIHVHGRGSKRAETLRGVPIMHRCGINSLVASYSNDGEAPNSADQRYGLGDTEWHDIDQAIAYAVAHGAQRIVLVGWSMGGSIVLQSAARGEFRDKIAGLILDSPAVDWIEALRYQGDAVGLPAPVQALTIDILGSKQLRWVSGLERPIDINRLNWVARAAEITTPTLIMHSDDDGYVPAGPSREVAAANPDAVTFVPFKSARHCKLWNYDRELWEGSVSNWLDAHGLAAE